MSYGARKSKRTGDSFVSKLKSSEKAISSELKRVQDMEIRLKSMGRKTEGTFRSELSIIQSMMNRQGQIERVFSSINDKLLGDMELCHTILKDSLKSTSYPMNGFPNLLEVFKKGTFPEQHKDALKTLAPRELMNTSYNKVSISPDMKDKFSVDDLIDLVSNLEYSDKGTLKRLGFTKSFSKVKKSADRLSDQKLKAESKENSYKGIGEPFDYRAADLGRRIVDKLLISFSKTMRMYGSTSKNLSPDINEALGYLKEKLSYSSSSGDSIWKYASEKNILGKSDFIKIVKTGKTKTQTNINYKTLSTKEALKDTSTAVNLVDTLKYTRTLLKNQMKVLSKMVVTFSGRIDYE